jgi:hypothetical protein
LASQVEEAREEAIALLIAIKRNDEYLQLRVICVTGILGVVLHISGMDRITAAAFWMILYVVTETRERLLQGQRRSELAAIFRTFPSLVDGVRREVEGMKADRRFWRSLNR